MIHFSSSSFSSSSSWYCYCFFIVMFMSEYLKRLFIDLKKTSMNVNETFFFLSFVIKRYQK